METIHLDFETFAEPKIGKVGAHIYLGHPSLLVLCAAFAVGGGPVQLWLPGDDLPFCFRNPALYRWAAFNAQFERLVWVNAMAKQYGCPGIPLQNWDCVAARSRAAGLPGNLARAAKALGLPIEKDDEGRRIMLQLSQPRRPSKNNPDTRWLPATAPEKFEKLYAYCKRDVEVEREISQAIPSLSGPEKLVWQLDQQINDRGVPIDVRTCKAAIRLEADYQARRLARLAELTDGQVTSGKQVQAMLTWLNSHGVDIDNLRAQTVQTELQKDHSPEALEVLKIRQETARAATAKLQAMIAQTDATGPSPRVRGAHLYYGAHTGRWAGRGLQPQNMFRGELVPAEIPYAIQYIHRGAIDRIQRLWGRLDTFLASLVRSMICAEESHTFLVIDYSQIEARVLAWLAGEDELIESFRQGRDVYSEFISKIYGRTITKADKAERFLGKTAVLGLGYGMGAAKFQATCEAQQPVDELLAIKIVNTYRKAYKGIKALWRMVNQAAIDATTMGKAVRVGDLRFDTSDRWLRVRLPSKRHIHYIDPQVRIQTIPARTIKDEDGKETYIEAKDVQVLTYMAENSLTKKWQRHATYGGKLVENIVQATARDFLVHGMQQLEAVGIPVIMHVHDEVVCEVQESTVSLKQAEACLTRQPSWGKGCPIAVEGFESRRFRKD